MRAHSKFNQNVTKLFCRHQHTRFKAGGAIGVEGQQARQDIQGRLPGSPPSAVQESVLALHALSALNSAFPTCHPLSLKHPSWPRAVSPAHPSLLSKRAVSVPPRSIPQQCPHLSALPRCLGLRCLTCKMGIMVPRGIL